MTAARLRTAAAKLREEGGRRNAFIAEWLEAEAIRWEKSVRDTTRPSRGIDEPPAIFWDNPEAACLNADRVVRYGLEVANAVLDEAAA